MLGNHAMTLFSKDGIGLDQTRPDEVAKCGQTEIWHQVLYPTAGERQAPVPLLKQFQQLASLRLTHLGQLGDAVDIGVTRIAHPAGAIGGKGFYGQDLTVS